MNARIEFFNSWIRGCLIIKSFLVGMDEATNARMEFLLSWARGCLILKSFLVRMDEATNARIEFLHSRARGCLILKSFLVRMDEVTNARTVFINSWIRGCLIIILFFVAFLPFGSLSDCENNRNNFTHVRVYPVIHSRNKILFTRLWATQHHPRTTGCRTWPKILSARKSSNLPARFAN